MTSPDSEPLPPEPAATEARETPADTLGRGLSLRAFGVMVVALLLGGVVSRVTNVRLVRSRAQQEHQRQTARIERARSQQQWQSLESQLAAKRAQRGLPKVEAAPGQTPAAPVQAN